MTARRVIPALLLALGLGIGACGGGEDAAPAGTPASEPPPPEATPPAQAETAAAVEPAAAPAEAGVAPEAAQEPTQAGDSDLVRELFAFRSSGRDPFLPLSAMENVRPFVEHLRVTSITYDPRYPGNSIAVLRDTSEVCTERCRYTVRVGDEVGQVRVLEIREGEVIVVREQFGIEQQLVLQLRRRQEGTP